MVELLAGRRAVVTGGTRGIGRAISLKLASWGASVAAVYVDRPGPARQLTAEHPHITAHQCDVTDPADLAALAAELGPVDIVVHAAAAATYGPLLEARPRDWDFTVDTNARSTLLVAQAFAPALANSRQARLITVTNAAPRKVIPGAGLLAAAKAATETLTRYLAAELAPQSIVVNCVQPGLVATDVVEVRPDYVDQLDRERATTPWPNAPTTTPEAVADAVAALCLPENRWVAGETITVDGGYRWWGHHQPDTP